MLVPPWAAVTRPTGTLVAWTIASANGRPRPAPLVRVLCVSAERASRVAGSPEWTGSGESTSQCSGSWARVHLPSIPSAMTRGLGGVTSIRSPTPSMFDCPARTQRSPTKNGPIGIVPASPFFVLTSNCT
jgi:hypothetical protein